MHRKTKSESFGAQFSLWGAGIPEGAVLAPDNLRIASLPPNSQDSRPNTSAITVTTATSGSCTAMETDIPPQLAARQPGLVSGGPQSPLAAWAGMPSSGISAAAAGPYIPPTGPGKPILPSFSSPGSPRVSPFSLPPTAPRHLKSVSESDAQHGALALANFSNDGAAPAGVPAASSREPSRTVVTRSGRGSGSLGTGDGDDDWAEADTACQQESGGGGGGRARDRQRGSNGRSNRELLMLDPKRVRRIMANRLSAAKSKERKQQYTEQLNQLLEERSAERDVLVQQLERLQADDLTLAAYEQQARAKAGLLNAQLNTMRQKGAALLEQLAAARRAAGLEAATAAAASGGGQEGEQQPQAMDVKAEAGAAAAPVGPVAAPGSRAPVQQGQRVPEEIAVLLAEPVSAEDAQGLPKAGAGCGAEPAPAAAAPLQQQDVPAGSAASAPVGPQVPSAGAEAGYRRGSPDLAGAEASDGAGAVTGTAAGLQPETWTSAGGVLPSPNQQNLEEEQHQHHQQLLLPRHVSTEGAYLPPAGAALSRDGTGREAGRGFGAASRLLAHQGVAGVGHHRASQSADEVQLQRLIPELGFVGPGAVGGTAMLAGLAPGSQLAGAGAGSHGVAAGAAGGGLEARLEGGVVMGVAPMGLERGTSASAGSPPLAAIAVGSHASMPTGPPGQPQQQQQPGHPSPPSAGAAGALSPLANFGQPVPSLMGPTLLPASAGPMGFGIFAGGQDGSAAVPMDLGLAAVLGQGLGLQAGGAGGGRYAAFGQMVPDLGAAGLHGAQLLPQGLPLGMHGIPTRQVTTAVRPAAANPFLS